MWKKSQKLLVIPKSLPIMRPHWHGRRRSELRFNRLSQSDLKLLSDCDEQCLTTKRESVRCASLSREAPLFKKSSSNLCGHLRRRLDWKNLINDASVCKKTVIHWAKTLIEEFDHGSDWTLAAGLTHASRTAAGDSLLSCRRVADGWVMHGELPNRGG